MLQRREVSQEEVEADEHGWTEADREGKTQRWNDACEWILLDLHNEQLTGIEQRRDFYLWFYEATAARDYHTRWALAAYVVAGGMADMASVDWTEGVAPVTNEIQGLARIGNQVIFDDVLPKLRLLWLNGPLEGDAALRSDAQILADEQALIQSLYDTLAPSTMERFERFANMSYTRAQIGAALGMGGYVEKGDHNVEGDVPTFSSLVPGGDIRAPDDRWRYGMGLGAQFSTLAGYGGHGAMPAPGADYSSGAAFARLNVREHLHGIDAMMNDADIPETEVVLLLQALTASEQGELFDDDFRVRRLMGALSFAEMRIGIEALTMLGAGEKMRLYEGCRSVEWDLFDYDDVGESIRSSPSSSRSALHTEKWRRVFVLICDDDTIADAVHDLQLTPELADEWLSAERSLF